MTNDKKGITNQILRFLTIFVCTRKEFPAFAYYMLLLTLIFGAIGFKILGV